VFAVAEHVGATGADFLLALAIAYEVQVVSAQWFR